MRPLFLLLGLTFVITATSVSADARPTVCEARCRYLYSRPMCHEPPWICERSYHNCVIVRWGRCWLAFDQP
jgi:hypothetical protein